MKAKITSHDIRCRKCNHLLAKVNTLPVGEYSIEIKCHSCKQINLLESNELPESEQVGRMGYIPTAVTIEAP